MKLRLTRLFALGTAISLLTVSCKKNADGPLAMDGEVKFTSSIEGINTTKAGDANWDVNDAIGVFAKNSGGTITDANIKYTTTGNGNFAATGYGINYPVDGSSLSFLAYYPHNATLSGTTYNVNVATQTNPAAIDLMYSSNATGYSQSSTTTPNLNFTHQLSKIELVVKAGTGVSSLTGVTALFQSFYTTAAFDLSTGVLSPGNTQADITARTVTTGVDPVASAIMIPVSNAEGKTVFFGLPNGDNFAWTMGAGTKFESGKKYTYTVTLQKQASGTTAVVLGAATITPWTDVPGGNVTAPLVGANKTKKVLFIGIDGCLWSTFSAANTPNIKALMDAGYTSTNALAEPPTWSAVGWSSLLTGTGPDKHKAIDNSFAGSDFVNNPSFFKQVKASLPAYRTGTIVTWSPINTYIVSASDVTFKTNSGGDGNTETGIINELTNNNPGVLFCHFDDVDHAGHDYGFSASVTQYINAVKATDTRIGNIITALRNRPGYAGEDWLIVISSDHGGTGTSHGGSSYPERNSFIILSNPAIAPTLVNATPTTSVQTMPNSVPALTFGSNVYGQLPSFSSTDLPLDAASSFTIEFRVRATATTSDPVIMGNKDWNSGYNQGIIISNNGGTIRANLGDGSNRTDVDGVNLKDGNWHYVSLVVNRGNQTATMYDGGQQVAQKSISSVGSLQSAMAFAIGQDGTTNYSPYFSGNISGIRIFKTALSAATISAHVFSDITASHPDYANLIFYTKGADGAGTQYAGSLGSAALNIVLRNSATANWSTVTSPVYVGSVTDYHGAPHLYDVAPTILQFLGIARPANYDGNTLVNF